MQQMNQHNAQPMADVRAAASPLLVNGTPALSRAEMRELMFEKFVPKSRTRDTQGYRQRSNVFEALRTDIPREERWAMVEGCLDAPHVIPDRGMLWAADRGRRMPSFVWRHPLDNPVEVRWREAMRRMAEWRNGSYPFWLTPEQFREYVQVVHPEYAVADQRAGA